MLRLCLLRIFPQNISDIDGVLCNIVWIFLMYNYKHQLYVAIMVICQSLAVVWLIFYSSIDIKTMQIAFLVRIVWYLVITVSDSLHQSVDANGFQGNTHLSYSIKSEPLSAMSSAQSTSSPTNSKSSRQAHVIDEEVEMIGMDDDEFLSEDDGADILDNLNGALTDDEDDFDCSHDDLERSEEKYTIVLPDGHRSSITLPMTPQLGTGGGYSERADATTRLVDTSQEMLRSESRYSMQSVKIRGSGISGPIVVVTNPDGALVINFILEKERNNTTIFDWSKYEYMSESIYAIDLIILSCERLFVFFFFVCSYPCTNCCGTSRMFKLNNNDVQWVTFYFVFL